MGKLVERRVLFFIISRINDPSFEQRFFGGVITFQNEFRKVFFEQFCRIEGIVERVMLFPDKGEIFRLQGLFQTHPLANIGPVQTGVGQLDIIVIPKSLPEIRRFISMA